MILCYINCFHCLFGSNVGFSVENVQKSHQKLPAAAGEKCTQKNGYITLAYEHPIATGFDSDDTFFLRAA